VQLRGGAWATAYASAACLAVQAREISELGPMDQRHAIEMPYDMAAGFLMIVAMLVGGLYCVQALQGERRDRSILFWKSLPVSIGRR
jgi:ABC-2 type transport system permease protein